MNDALVSQAFRTLALFSCEGASTALFICGLTGGHWLPAFIAKNHVPADDRNRLIASVVVGALAPCAVAAGFSIRSWNAGGFNGLGATVDRAWRLARAAAIMLTLWAVPPVLSWRAWQGRDVIFLLIAGALALAIERAAIVSLRAASELEIPTIVKRRTKAEVSAIRAWSQRWGPPLIVAAAVTGYISYASYYTVLQHHARQTTAFDLGGYGSFFWNTIHGRPFYCPIFHPRTTLYLMIHAEPAVYLLAPLYALRPVVSTLLLVQSALLGLSAVPLYLFARSRLQSRWLAAVLALAFLLLPAVHLPNFYDFHFLTISTFFILWAAHFYQSGRSVPFWIAVAAALMCREDVAFGGIGVGIFVLLSTDRWRTGAALTLLSASYLIAIKFIVMPAYGEPSFVHHYVRLIAPGERGFSGVMKTIISNPMFALATMFVPEKLPLALHLLVPTAFLLLRRPRYLGLLLGGILVVFLTSDAPPIIDVRYQYVAHFTPYAFIAATLALEDIGLAQGKVARLAAAAAVASGTVFATSQFGALNQATFVSGHGKVVFSVTEQQRETLRHLYEIARTIPSEGTLAATERDAPHVAEREHLFTLKYADQADADYLLFGYDNLDYGDARSIVRDALLRGTHGVHAERPGFVVLRRDAPTSKNRELLERIR